MGSKSVALPVLGLCRMPPLALELSVRESTRRRRHFKSANKRGSASSMADKDTASTEDNVRNIVSLVGGPENVKSVGHCFTRLRFILKDEGVVDKDKLTAADGVMGVMEAGGQIQVVIGNNVTTYYDTLVRIFNISADGDVEAEETASGAPKQKMKFMDKVTDLASAIFLPSISLLAACGTLQGFLSLLTTFNLMSTTSGTYLVLSTIADSVFYYFPVFLAYATAKKFGGRPFYSMIIAFVLIHPNITTAASSGDTYSFLGIPLVLMNYSKSVFPAILSSYLACKIEKVARKIIPDCIKMIFVPLIVFLITVPIALLVIGPVTTWLMNLVTTGITMLYDFSPVVTGAVAGGIWQILVLFGISKAFIPLFTSDLATNGYSALIAVVFFASVLAQVGSVLAYCARSRNEKIRQVGVASAISGCFGITEPAMFGINIPARKPYVFGLIGGAAGGLVAALFGAKGYSFGAGLIGIGSLLGPEGVDMSFYGGLLGMLVAFVISFAMTWFFGWSKDSEDALKM